MGSVYLVYMGRWVLHPQTRYYSDRWPRNNTSSNDLKQKHVQLGQRNAPLKNRSLSFPQVENCTRRNANQVLWFEVGVRCPGLRMAVDNQLLETLWNECKTLRLIMSQGWLQPFQDLLLKQMRRSFRTGSPERYYGRTNTCARDPYFGTGFKHGEDFRLLACTWKKLHANWVTKPSLNSCNDLR